MKLFLISMSKQKSHSNHHKQFSVAPLSPGVLVKLVEGGGIQPLVGHHLHLVLGPIP